MDNSVNNTNNQSINQDNEVNVSAIQQLFNEFIENGGQPKVTEFKRYFDKLVNEEIKPQCGRSSRAATGDDWRSNLKAKFSGRGAKWVIVPLAEINPTITAFEEGGIDCDDYKTWVEANGGAWIRFSGPRINEGKPAAAFEVRVNGSTIDHPKQLHMISLDVLDETIRPLNGTPHSMKLEETKKAEEVKETVEENTESNEEIAETIDELIEYVDDDCSDDDDDDFDSAF